MKKYFSLLCLLMLVGNLFISCENSTNNNLDDKNPSIPNIPEPDIAPFVPTENPTIMPAGTDGSFGTDGTYILFGDWPQTVKEDDVKVGTSVVKINGWDCYKGTDGGYYVKLKYTPEFLQNNIFFDNGKKIENNKEYYLKMEPIKWSVLSTNFIDKKNANKGYLLLTDKIIDSSCYLNKEYTEPDRNLNGKTIHGNNYEYSLIRAYLNGLDGSGYEVGNFENKGFLNKAFTPKAQELINITNVDNSLDSVKDYKQLCKWNVDKEFICDDTDDKVFLLSLNEATSKKFGFKDYKDVQDKDPARIRKYTDYCKLSMKEYLADDIYNFWWLRSHAKDGTSIEGSKNLVAFVSGGGFSIDDDLLPAKYGFCPAITVNIKK